MKILGISAFYHDSAAALLIDGKIVAAAQEERFTRKKHDNCFPRCAIAYVLKEGGIAANDLDFVVFYEKPFLKLRRIISSFFSDSSVDAQAFGRVMQNQIAGKFWVASHIREELGYKGKIKFLKHHESHAASAFYPSPFQRAAILTVDGVGEWDTTTYGVGNGNRIDIKKRINFPHSLGLLYAAFTYFTGFKVNSGEYKVMGLAPYGSPKYAQMIFDELIDVKDDGSFRLNMDYFDFTTGRQMITSRFEELFRRPRRSPEAALTQDDMDFARSIQEVTETVLLRMARHIKKETKEDYLCLAGGVALNCVANGKILREGIFKDLWIQPAAGDAGGALGAALQMWFGQLGNPRSVSDGRVIQQRYSFLGPQFAEDDIKEFLDSNEISYEHHTKIEETAAELLAQGKVVGWFSGRMEFGPRALGARSIIGDARNPEMQKTMNLKIKFRESFRPFAPAVLEEKAGEWFEIDRPSPFMLLVADVLKKRRKEVVEDTNAFGMDKLKIIRSEIPAVTHVDYSARIQTVSEENNKKFYNLIKAFNRLTGCPVIVNTSFNVRGEPLVCAPEDAYRCFMRTNMDYLVLENFLIDKRKQRKSDEGDNWRSQFELD